MMEEGMKTVSLSDWLLEKIMVDSLWARKELLREAKLALAVLVCSVDGLETPSEGGAVYLSNGRKAAQNLDGILSAIAALDAGVPPDQILLPLWGPRGEEAAEEVEPVEGTPLRELGLSMRVHGYLARGLKGELGRWPLVEDIVRILSEKGEKGLRAIRGVGPKALEEILAALKAKSFIMEPWEE